MHAASTPAQNQSPYFIKQGEPAPCKCSARTEPMRLLPSKAAFFLKRKRLYGIRYYTGKWRTSVRWLVDRRLGSSSANTPTAALIGTEELAVGTPLADDPQEASQGVGIIAGADEHLFRAQFLRTRHRYTAQQRYH
jgi:hypothetical protein